MAHELAKQIKLLTVCAILLSASSCSYLHNDDFLQRAEQAVAPNTNFLFARNASLPGRLFMTFSGRPVKTCINTVSAFYNKYHTCSNCEDFIKQPERWNFKKVAKPKVGDMVIYIHSKTGKAYHAAILVGIKNGKYYINHAVKTNYFKNIELKTNSKLTFYRFMPSKE